MRLSKYPSLVRNEILDNMSFPNLFMLSFVSKNMKKMIKSSQLQRFKSIDSVEYDCCDRLPHFFNIRYQSRIKETFTYAQKKETENKNKANNTDGVSLYVSGYIIDFQFSEYNSLVTTFHPYEKEHIIKSIHNYLISLIGDSMEYHWKTNHYSSSIPQLQNLSACILFNIRFNMRKNAADEKTIERLFSSSPSLKYAHMSFINIPLSPESESKLYQAESIKISQLTPMTPAVLYNFQGRQAIIRCFRCHFSNLIEFVNRWKSGEAYHKLEYLKIETFNLEAFEDDILNAIGAKRIDSQKPSVTHTLPRRFIEYTSQTKTDPIITHSYVVRESDNRVASVLIEERTLSFGVWNKTEEEFLRMME